MEAVESATYEPQVPAYQKTSKITVTPVADFVVPEVTTTVLETIIDDLNKQADSPFANGLHQATNFSDPNVFTYVTRAEFELVRKAVEALLEDNKQLHERLAKHNASAPFRI